MTRACAAAGVLLAVLCWAPSWTQGRPDPAKERAALEEAIRGNICWALTKDRALLERTTAHDADLFIFNPDSKATIGWDELAKNFALLDGSPVQGRHVRHPSRPPGVRSVHMTFCC